MSRNEADPFDHVVDEGSFQRHEDTLTPRDPISYPGYGTAIEDARRRSGNDEAVVTGRATIGGHTIEMAAFDFSFLGGSMGEVAGERVARAIERAAQDQVPFVLLVRTGGARMQEGMRSLVQLPKLVAARGRLTEAHVPFLVVLADPTTGGVLASIAGLADYTIAEAGATIGFAGPRVVEAFTGSAPAPGSHSSASARAAGLVDVVVERDVIPTRLSEVLEVLSPDEPSPAEPPQEVSGGKLDEWDAVRAARDPERPGGPALARSFADVLVELHGDRMGTDDPSLFCAVTRSGGRRSVVLAMDRSLPLGTGAFRKARRCLSLAQRLRIPVVTLVDTPGADPSESSESEGIAWEISALFDAMLHVEVPVVSVVIGEGGSGGALAFATADVLLAFSDAIFSVIGPEAAAAILWRDPERAPEAARALKLGSESLLRLGIADGLLPEPPSSGSLRAAVSYHLARIDNTGDLVAKRRARWRGSHG